MPNLPAHIGFAHRTAGRLQHPILESHMGQFLLGSMSPDIRIVTRGTREMYHFAPLDFEAVGEGVARLLQNNPHLGPSSLHDGPTLAFVVGYITHLLADETWISDMYRPYFGNPVVFGDSTRGKVMDRALQLKLDRQAWDAVESSIGILESAADGIDPGFIPLETLDEWQHWTVEFLSKGFTWDRLRSMARRIAGGDDDHPANAIANEFVESMPDSLEDLYLTVPLKKVEEYKEKTLDALEAAVSDYLS